jgi:hypothetical protein
MINITFKIKYFYFKNLDFLHFLTEKLIFGSSAKVQKIC